MVIKRLFEFDGFLKLQILAYILGGGGGGQAYNRIYFFTGRWAYKWGGGGGALLIESLRHLEPINNKDTLQGIPQVKMNDINFQCFVINK